MREQKTGHSLLNIFSKIEHCTFAFWRDAVLSQCGDIPVFVILH